MGATRWVNEDLKLTAIELRRCRLTYLQIAATIRVDWNTVSVMLREHGDGVRKSRGADWEKARPILIRHARREAQELRKAWYGAHPHLRLVGTPVVICPSRVSVDGHARSKGQKFH